MRLGELKDKAVISVEGARKVGSVDEVLVDPKDWHIAGVVVKSARGGAGYLILGDDIQSIGPDAVTVSTGDLLQPLERTQIPAGLPSLGTITNSKVVTEGGELLGTISQVEIDSESRLVTAFEYGSGPLAGLLNRQHMLDPRMVVGVGPGLFTVRDAARPEREAGA